MSTKAKNMETTDLLNGKKLDFTEIENVDHKSECVIYKDKSMTISIDGDLVYMSSTWWGQVKNSFFTLGGMKGPSKTKKHGKVNIHDSLPYNSRGPIIDINRHNKAGEISINPEETPLQFLGRWIQIKQGKNISYTNVNQTGPDHAPTITVRLVLPNGKEYIAKGPKKQYAANEAAKQALDELDLKY